MNRASRKFNFEEFKKLHSETVRSSFLDIFTEPFIFITFAGDDSNTIVFPLPDRRGEARVSLGSGSKANIHVASPDVAEEHLHIFYHEILEWCFEDRGSGQGATLDGVRVTPFGVHSLHEESLVEIGDVRIQLVPVSRVAEIIFPHSGDSTADEVETLDEDPPGPVTTRLKRREPRAQIQDPAQLKRFLSVLTNDEAEPLLPLVMDARYISKEAFLERHDSPILVLREVAMQADKPPLYDFEDAPLELRVYWKLVPNPKRPLVLGRSRATDICIHAKVVSKRHAELRLDGETWVLRDLGSINRLFVNKDLVPANSEMPLASGAVLRVSPHVSLDFIAPRDILSLARRLQAEFDF